MPETKLTTHLLSTTPSQLEHATQHPFLQHAGRGTLPSSTLSAWLVQDMHYQRGYVAFLGGLLSSLRIPVGPDVFGSSSSNTNDNSSNANEPAARSKNIYARTFNALTSALTGIQAEMAFFEDTARTYSLDLAWDMDVAPATQAYVDLFERFAGTGGVYEHERRESKLLEGLVVLWATEHCYHEAWTYAKKHQGTGGELETLDASSSAADVGAVAALHGAFIPNWTAEGFKAFVDECGDVLDAFYETLCRDPSGGEEAKRKCEEVFKEVVELEVRFWPDV